MDESAIGRGGRITVAKPVTPTEFIREMEGCVKEDSPIPKIDPLRLKRIWGKIMIYMDAIPAGGGVKK